MTSLLGPHGADCLCLTRRRMIGAATIGAASLLLSPAARAGGSVDTLVLTCMDYRLVDDAVSYFSARGMKNGYDHVVLAGAGIGVLGKLSEAWAETFWKHVDTAIKLHHVKELIVVNHRDCGAAKIAFGAASIAERIDETALHRTVLHQLRGQVNSNFPKLRTQMLLMDLDGSVEDLSGTIQVEQAPDDAQASLDAGTASKRGAAYVKR